MKDVINLGVVNFPTVWGDSAMNLKQMMEYIECAGKSGIEMLVFPETALTGYDVEPQGIEREERMQRKLAETVPGPSSEAIAELTKKYDMYVIYGMAERDSVDPEKVYNAAAVIGPEGVIGTSRKVHLPFSEMQWADRGEKPFLFDTPWGPVGVGICYDFYQYPEVTRYARAMGARLFINCTAINTTETNGAGGYLGNLSLRYQVVNNDMFVASSNLCGKDVTSWFMGGSSIVGPSSVAAQEFYYAGKPFLAEGADENGIESATVNLGSIRNSFLDCVWAGGIGKGDWNPDKYIAWYSEARDSNYWGK